VLLWYSPHDDAIYVALGTLLEIDAHAWLLLALPHAQTALLMA
jgi:hypothetical protein